MTTEDRELLIRIHERQIRMEDRQIEIHTKVTITNGRVTDLEKSRSILIGIGYAVTLGGSLIAFLLNFVFK